MLIRQNSTSVGRKFSAATPVFSMIVIVSSFIESHLLASFSRRAASLPNVNPRLVARPWSAHKGAIAIDARSYFSVSFHAPFLRPGVRRTMCSSSIEVDELSELPKRVESEWNVGGMKKEVQRHLMRCIKKKSKVHERVRNAKSLIEELTTDPNASLEDLEKCPNIEALEFELKQLQDRLDDLNTLNDLLVKVKGNVVLPLEVAELAIDLGVDDKAPKRPERGPLSKKGPKKSEPSRLPYRRYFSFENIEIRVGKKAEDNDILTLSSEHRDGSDFWMHAAGCPGSHVVIRSNGLSILPEEVVKDAAALAAHQSKARGQSTILVSMTLCRDIVKPLGAKAGLVQLTGKVRTVKVNMTEAQSRLERLNSTVLVN